MHQDDNIVKTGDINKLYFYCESSDHLWKPRSVIKSAIGNAIKIQ